MLAEEGMNRRWRVWLIPAAPLGLNEELSCRGARASPVKQGRSAGLPRGCVGTHGSRAGSSKALPWPDEDPKHIALPPCLSFPTHTSCMVVVNHHTEVTYSWIILQLEFQVFDYVTRV